MTNHKRFAASVLMVVLLLNVVFCSVAVAEGYTAYVTDNYVKIYEKWNTSSKCIYAMSYGEALTCTAIQNGWAQLKAPNGAVGYCKTDSLSATNPCTLNAEVITKSSQTPVYKSLASKSLGIAYIDSGITLDVVGATKDGSWLRVKKGKHYGYVAKSSTQTAQIVYLNPENAMADIYTSSGASVATIPFAQSLILVGLNGSIASVRTSTGKTGYISKSLLMTSDPNTMNATAFIQADGAYIYKMPSTNGSTLTRLSKNETVTVTARCESENWYRVQKGSTVGYMRGETLGKSTADSTKLLYSIMDQLNVVDKISSSASVVATLEHNESVAVISFQKGGIQIITQDGEVGYCAYGTLIGG